MQMTHVDGLMRVAPSVQISSRSPEAFVIGSRGVRCGVLTEAEYAVLYQISLAQRDGAGGLRQSEIPPSIYESLKYKGLIDRVAELQLSHQAMSYGESAGA